MQTTPRKRLAAIITAAVCGSTVAGLVGWQVRAHGAIGLVPAALGAAIGIAVRLTQKAMRR